MEHPTQSKRNEEAKIIREREITALSKVEKVAIQGCCERIWATATEVWATRMNNLRFASRPRPATQTRRQIWRRVALTLQEEDEEAVRKSPLGRFNLERANSLARQIRKAARGTKRRWTLQESEAQRWSTLGAAARLRWLARAEEKRKKKTRTKKHTPKVKESEAHKQNHARLLHESHGEGADSRGASSSGPPHKGKREEINSLDRWLLKGGDISQGAKLDRSRPSAGRTDDDPRPQL